jgi:hypothetical protein
MLGLADCLWIGGAAVHGRGEVVFLREGGGVGLIHHGGAVMCALSPAAGRQQRCYVGAEGQKRRDQREADKEDEQDGEGTPHAVSVSDVRRRDGGGCPPPPVVLRKIFEGNGLGLDLGSVAV